MSASDQVFVPPVTTAAATPDNREAAFFVLWPMRIEWLREQDSKTDELNSALAAEIQQENK
jgi:hypothetical protein